MAHIITIKNDSGSIQTWAGKDFAIAEEYTVPTDTNRSKWINNSGLLTAIGNGDALVGNGTVYFADVNSAVDWIKGNISNVNIEGVTPTLSKLPTVNNRIPDGYSIYGVGESDDIVNGSYGEGDPLQFNNTTNEREFQLLKHYYAIGARAVWKNCDIDNYFNATLLAPATTAFTNATGDYDKVEIIPSSGLHLFKPVDVGTGSWNGDLTSTLTNTPILKGTPVPVAGNTGWFDYDPSSNILTANSSQTGGYNLYDFDVNLHAFGRKIWGTNLNGGITGIDIPDLVGKLIFNTWKVKLTLGLEGGLLSTNKAAITVYVGIQGNI